MSLETIVAAIAAESVAEMERVTERASHRVESILDEANARALEEQARWEASRAEETSRVVAGIVNSARLDSDRRVAAAREALFQEALGRLVDLIHAVVASSDYPDIFRALHSEAMSVVPDPAATILVRSADLELAESVAQDRGATGAVEGVLDCIGGLEVEADDGRSVKNTVDARLAQSERRLRRLAVQHIPEMSESRV